MTNTNENKPCSSEKTESELIKLDIPMPVTKSPIVETVSKIVIILFIILIHYKV